MLKEDQTGLGLATAGLVLGIISVLYAIFVVGAFAGIIGVIITIIHLIRRLPYKKLAVWGLILSILGIAASAGFGLLNIKQNIQRMTELYSQGYQDYNGKAAPELNLTTIDGNEFNLSNLKGKRVLLDFWATWCPPCKKELPLLIKLRNETSADNLVIIGISNEQAGIISDFGKKNKINYPLISAGIDANLPMPFSEVESIPTLFIIDANGIIENAVVGYHPYEQLKEYALGSKK
jgi:peroxiredoxin